MTLTMEQSTLAANSNREIVDQALGVFIKQGTQPRDFTEDVSKTLQNNKDFLDSSTVQEVLDFLRENKEKLTINGRWAITKKIAHDTCTQKTFKTARAIIRKAKKLDDSPIRLALRILRAVKTLDAENTRQETIAIPKKVLVEVLLADPIVEATISAQRGKLNRTDKRRLLASLSKGQQPRELPGTDYSKLRDKERDAAKAAIVFSAALSLGTATTLAVQAGGFNGVIDVVLTAAYTTVALSIPLAPLAAVSVNRFARIRDYFRKAKKPSIQRQRDAVKQIKKVCNGILKDEIRNSKNSTHTSEVLDQIIGEVILRGFAEIDTSKPKVKNTAPLNRIQRTGF